MDKILEALPQFFMRLRLWCIIDEYQEAGRFRFGGCPLLSRSIPLAHARCRPDESVHVR